MLRFLRRHGQTARSLCLAAAAFAASQSIAAQRPARPLPQLGRAPIRAIVAAMSDSEKVRLVVGTGLILPAGAPADMMPPPMRGSARTPDDAPLRLPGAAGETHAIRRFGIPSITLSDGPAGVRIDAIRIGANGKPDSARTYYATAFPVGTLLASSWDTSLVRRVGVAFGEEARDFGVDVLLMPGMNLHRNPRGGRNFEYYSEDPLVTGLMASSIVRGGQASGVATSVKHFVANEQEFNRMRLNSAISERTLREMYLRPFQMVVRRAAPATVMSSYNLVNGVHTAESRELLTGILRSEWGFRGLVMSDWFGGEDPVAMINAGNDLLMPGTGMQEAALRAALASGQLSRAALDASVTRTLELILQSNTGRGLRASEQPDLRAHAAVARQAAAESMVLLRNASTGSGSPALPLGAGQSVAAFGNTSYELIAGGTGSGNVNRAYTVSIVEGLDAAQIRVDTDLRAAYTRHLAAERAKLPPPDAMSFFAPPPAIAELPVNAAQVTAAAEHDDVGLITIGRIAGEGGDRGVDGDFTLRADERALIQSVSAAFHARKKPVVVVLNVGGPVEVASWREQVDAIVLAYQPGQEGGHAVADLLRGVVNPSGRLATSFPVSYDDIPFAADFPGRAKAGAPAPGNPMESQASENTYREGVFVGYRYAQTFGKAPAYGFGHGLSYTTFRYDDLAVTGRVAGPSGAITVTARVTNTGRVAGRDVVQLYVSAPSGTLDKPARELRGFVKTGTLAPGASQQVTFRLTAADLASFDTAASAWVTDAGVYTVRVAESSAADGVSTTTTVPQRVVVERTTHRVAPVAPVDELRRPAR